MLGEYTSISFLANSLINDHLNQMPQRKFLYAAYYTPFLFILTAQAAIDNPPCQYILCL